MHYHSRYSISTYSVAVVIIINVMLDVDKLINLKHVWSINVFYNLLTKTLLMSLLDLCFS